MAFKESLCFDGIENMTDAAIRENDFLRPEFEQRVKDVKAFRLNPVWARIDELHKKLVLMFSGGTTDGKFNEVWDMLREARHSIKWIYKECEKDNTYFRYELSSSFIGALRFPYENCLYALATLQGNYDDVINFWNYRIGDKRKMTDSDKNRAKKLQKSVYAFVDGSKKIEESAKGLYGKLCANCHPKPSGSRFNPRANNNFSIILARHTIQSFIRDIASVYVLTMEELNKEMEKTNNSARALDMNVDVLICYDGINEIDGAHFGRVAVDGRLAGSWEVLEIERRARATLYLREEYTEETGMNWCVKREDERILHGGEHTTYREDWIKTMALPVIRFPPKMTTRNLVMQNSGRLDYKATPIGGWSQSDGDDADAHFSFHIKADFSKSGRRESYTEVGIDKFIARVGETVSLTALYRNTHESILPKKTQDNSVAARLSIPQ